MELTQTSEQTRLKTAEQSMIFGNEKFINSKTEIEVITPKQLLQVIL